MKWILLTFLTIFLFLSCSVEGAWDIFGRLAEDGGGQSDEWVLGSWNNRHKLTFDNTAQTEDLLDFPVYLNLNPSRVDYTRIALGGDDLRFIDGGTGASLSYEIESWNPGGISSLWVKVEQIDGGSDADYMYMYYGNGSAAPSVAPSQVWDSNYRAVWHLNDNLADSTLYANDGVNSGSVDAPGTVGNGQEFDGASFIRVLDDPSLRILDDLTLEAWAYKHAVDDMTIVGKYSGPGNNRSYKVGLDYTVAPNGPYVSLSATGSFDPVGGLLEHAPSEASNIWQYIVGVHSGSSILLYVDGRLAAQNLSSFPSLFDNTENVIIGAEQDGAAGEFDGVIDEVRLSAAARSADWIAAQHLSMIDSFVSFGGMEAE